MQVRSLGYLGTISYEMIRVSLQIKSEWTIDCSLTVDLNRLGIEWEKSRHKSSVVCKRNLKPRLLS
jgi:hypothetical protein